MIKTILKTFLFTFLILWVAGCAPQSAQAPVGAALDETALIEIQETEISPNSRFDNQDLGLETLMEYSIFAPSIGLSVTLKDGEYLHVDGTRVFLMPQAAFGDLNHDQAEDAVALLAEETADHKVVVSLIVLIAENDAFIQTDTLLIGEGAEVSSIAIKHGEITLNAQMRNTAEDLNLPERKVWLAYQFLGRSLVLTKVSSSINQGTLRAIEISSPVDENIVGASVVLKGSMPVSPFENNLRFAVYDLEGKLLSQSGFMVDAEDMGAPAVFNNLVDLPPLPSGARIRLELADLSMADGSLIAMDSVWVMLE